MSDEWPLPFEELRDRRECRPCNAVFGADAQAREMFMGTWDRLGADAAYQWFAMRYAELHETHS